MSKKIELTNGLVAIVDEDCFAILSQHTWAEISGGYAATKICGTQILMHRFILGAKTGQLVDHKNGNKLDNRKENLIFSNHSNNNQNRSPVKRFPFIGVKFVPRNKSYQAHLNLPGGKRVSKNFQNIEEAARHYDTMALKHYGEDAMTNLKFIEKLLESLKAKG